MSEFAMDGNDPFSATHPYTIDGLVATAQVLRESRHLLRWRLFFGGNPGGADASLLTLLADWCRRNPEWYVENVNFTVGDEGDFTEMLAWVAHFTRDASHDPLNFPNMGGDFGV